MSPHNHTNFPGTCNVTRCICDLCCPSGWAVSPKDSPMLWLDILITLSSVFTLIFPTLSYALLSRQWLCLCLSHWKSDSHASPCSLYHESLNQLFQNLSNLTIFSHCIFRFVGKHSRVQPSWAGTASVILVVACTHVQCVFMYLQTLQVSSDTWNDMQQISHMDAQCVANHLHVKNT